MVVKCQYKTRKSLVRASCLMLELNKNLEYYAAKIEESEKGWQRIVRVGGCPIAIALW